MYLHHNSTWTLSLMENRASERAINMKNFQKMEKNIHEAIYTLRPNLNFNRQTSTIVTCWKEILREKSHRRHYRIIIIKFKMHISLFAHSALRNQHQRKHWGWSWNAVSNVRYKFKYLKKEKKWISTFLWHYIWKSSHLQG